MKNYELPKWQDKKLIEKVLHIITLLIAGIIVLLFFLKLFFCFEIINISEILLGILLLLLGIEYLSYNKKMAIFNLIVGLIIFICGITILVL